MVVVTIVHGRCMKFCHGYSMSGPETWIMLYYLFLRIVMFHSEVLQTLTDGRSGLYGTGFVHVFVNLE